MGIALSVAAGLVFAAATIVGLRWINRRFDPPKLIPATDDELPDEDGETEEELYRQLQAVGADVTPEEIADWDAIDYHLAWRYVRDVSSPDGSLVAPSIPRCLRPRNRRRIQ